MSGVTEIGQAPTGEPIARLVLEGGGLRVALLTYGATVQDVRLDGIDHPLVLGSDDPAAYFGPMHYFGAIVGRVANRIAGGRAPLDGKILDLDRNENGQTTLHGGSDGASARVWRIEAHDASTCTMALRLPDGQAGFPGNLDIRATFALPGDGVLSITLEALTDAPTFCNLAHHGYWSLDGGPDIRGQRMQIAADRYLAVDAALIPTGDIPVAGTRYDFRQMRPVVEADAAPIDISFCLTGDQPALRLMGERVGLDLTTDAPALQVYDAARIDTGTTAGLGGQPYGAYSALALEPQDWPDAPNNPAAPSILLRPGEVYRQHSEFRLFRTG
ncbi:galactose mutarotase [Rhodobacterales bacterium HKCCE3408]|nr:galactose mutarotase [Rhodobacterales bacterium HKCCE3408]